MKHASTPFTSPETPNPKQEYLRKAAAKLNVSMVEYIADAVYLETHRDGDYVYSPPQERLVSNKVVLRLKPEVRQAWFGLDAKSEVDVLRRVARIQRLHALYRELAT